MRRRREWASRPEEDLRNVQRLASRLQRMVKTGQGFPLVLKQVDEHFLNLVSQEISEILGRIEFLMGRTEEASLKEGLGQIYISMVDLLEDFESRGGHSYQRLLESARSVDPVRLNNLIDVDSELVFSLSKLKEVLKNLSPQNIDKSELQELHSLLDDVCSTLSARAKIVKG
ncbi:MAG: hypothetical protein QW815_06930 [Nitrososphaerota archaeon]